MTFNVTVFQMLKERLCFDPEFWNLLTLRTHCIELMSDKVMKAAVLNEMKEEEEKEYSEEPVINKCLNNSCTQNLDSCQNTEAVVVKQDIPVEQPPDGEAEKHPVVSGDSPLKRRRWRRRLRKSKQSTSDDEADPGNDPEFKYNLKTISSGCKPVYSLRHNLTNVENSTSVKLPLNRKREYLSRCVKSQILKRKGRKKRWLQGLPRLEAMPTVKERVKIRGKKRVWRSLQKLELFYPDNELFLAEFSLEEMSDTEDNMMAIPVLENELKQESEQVDHLEKDDGHEEHNDMDYGSSVIAHTKEDSEMQHDSKFDESLVPAIEANPELDGEPLDLFSCPVEELHSYCIKMKNPDGDIVHPSESSEGLDDNTEQEPQPTMETEMSSTEVSLPFF